jgi:hypothetical protein
VAAAAGDKAAGMAVTGAATSGTLIGEMGSDMGVYLNSFIYLKKVFI